QLRGRGDHDHLVEVVVWDLLIDRHVSTVLRLWIIRFYWSDDRSVREMAEVVLFHHVQGLTDGVRAFAEELAAGGHIVHTRDLFDGQRPATIEDGIAFTQGIGDEVLGERADRAVAGLPEGLVYAGFSYGVMLAQRFAQTRPGARGALLYDSC